MASNRILSEIARKSGGKLIGSALGRVLPDEGPARKSLIGGLAAAAAIRIATRSVPGAIVVGGGILAKKLYDRRRAGKDAPKG